MNLTSSALKEHFLSSILPYQSYQKPKQITKNREFYKPDQCIWNNPHRTSNKIYFYYHKQNDDYNSKIKPEIEDLQNRDRKNSQLSRINDLNRMRHQTRQKFYNLKQKRQRLESKTRATSARRNFSSCSHTKNQKLTKTIQLGTESANRTLNSYVKKVESYDLALQKVKSMISAQVNGKHRAIRSQFQYQRNRNELVNSQIKKRTFTKLDNH